ncbi:hypothetical protein K491DRAFT_370444 [Lophiostoma macrostomum CBS 122681]|uniref:Uncharacterized protein n=1 Tax=Lophiostoma macrostomum CBS 122681 TaxID=1314788 RepID=A0A6A6TAH2_9PLEO|nr:hypothetical protein K491DRAFT_370444 [Lophiostoma macrostomum CBS 122681]
MLVTARTSWYDSIMWCRYWVRRTRILTLGCWMGRYRPILQRGINAMDYGPRYETKRCLVSSRQSYRIHRECAPGEPRNGIAPFAFLCFRFSLLVLVLVLSLARAGGRVPICATTTGLENGLTRSAGQFPPVGNEARERWFVELGQYHSSW